MALMYVIYKCNPLYNMSTASAIVIPAGCSLIGIIRCWQVTQQSPNTLVLSQGSLPVEQPRGSQLGSCHQQQASVRSYSPPTSLPAGAALDKAISLLVRVFAQIIAATVIIG